MNRVLCIAAIAATLGACSPPQPAKVAKTEVATEAAPCCPRPPAPEDCEGGYLVTEAWPGGGITMVYKVDSALAENDYSDMYVSVGEVNAYTKQGMQCRPADDKEVQELWNARQPISAN